MRKSKGAVERENRQYTQNKVTREVIHVKTQEERQKRIERLKEKRGKS